MCIFYVLYFFMKYFIIWIVILCFYFFLVFASEDSLLTVELSSRWLIIWTPANLSLWSVTPWSTIETNFSDYFWVEDLRWTNTWHYTTIQCDGLYGPSGAMITGVELSGAVVDLVAWLANNTLIYSNLINWTDITEPKLYLYRNNDISNGWKINRYGNKPAIKVTVPSDVPAGSYKGKITYTLYDMPFSY